MAALLLVGGGSTVVALQAGGTDRPAAAAAAEPGSALGTWLRANTDRSSTVASADPALRRDLAATGLAVTGTGSADTLPTGAYLVGVTTAAAPTAPAAVAGGRALVAVARFTDGAATTEAAQVVARTPQQVTDAVTTERATATAAASGLLANTGLTVAADARPAFEAGTVDLRAAAFLALLATGTPTRVVQVPVDAAERAAGLADRRVVVVVTDPTTLRRAADGTRSPFAPEITTDPGLPAGAVTLTWPLSADPTTVVS